MSVQATHTMNVGIGSGTIRPTAIVNTRIHLWIASMQHTYGWTGQERALAKTQIIAPTVVLEDAADLDAIAP